MVISLFFLVVLSINVQASTATADILTEVLSGHLDPLPAEIQKMIIDHTATMPTIVLSPRSYTAHHRYCTTAQLLILTCTRHKDRSKEIPASIKSACAGVKSKDPILMSVYGFDYKAILSRYAKGRSYENDLDVMQEKALDHLKDLLLRLEAPLAQETFLDFLNRSRLIPPNEPRALMFNLQFIIKHYSPLMKTLVEKKEYFLLSRLTSLKWPLVIGNYPRQDNHVKLLFEQSKTNLERRAVRDMVHKAYKCEIRDNTPEFSYVDIRLRQPGESCSIL